MYNLYHIGDSISLGQYNLLKQIFLDDYTRYIEDINNKDIIIHKNNCQSSSFQLKDSFIDSIPECEVIIHNCGLWDLQTINGRTRTSIEDYENNLNKLSRILSTKCKKYVYVLTTKIITPNRHNMTKENWKRFTDVEKKVVSKFKYVFDYNDLDLEHIDGVHFTKNSYILMANKIAEYIRGVIDE